MNKAETTKQKKDFIKRHIAEVYKIADQLEDEHRGLERTISYLDWLKLATNIQRNIYLESIAEGVNDLRNDMRQGLQNISEVININIPGTTFNH